MPTEHRREFYSPPTLILCLGRVLFIDVCEGLIPFDTTERARSPVASSLSPRFVFIGSGRSGAPIDEKIQVMNEAEANAGSVGVRLIGASRVTL